MKIYLIGLKNSGKTTTGKRLANKLNLRFLDLDELIEKEDGRTIPEIYTQDGEDAFRKKEKAALIQTAVEDDFVVATGGGAPRFFDNMDFMKKHGVTIYLKLDENTLVGRLKVAAKTRPIVRGKTPEQIGDYVRDLLENHEHFYLQAEHVVDAKNLAPDELVTKILASYET